MKNLYLVIVLSGLLTSCCLVTSRDCFCKPPEPFLIESTKDWIVPFLSEDQKFTTIGSPVREQKIFRTYEEGTECIGGDECCADNRIHTTGFLFNIFTNQALLYTKAVQNEVIFSAELDGYAPDIYIAVFDVTTGKFFKWGGINLVETDTTINGAKHLKVIFQKTDPTKNKIIFKRLEFVKGIGVTGYTDTSGQAWKKE